MRICTADLYETPHASDIYISGLCIVPCKQKQHVFLCAAHEAQKNIKQKEVVPHIMRFSLFVFMGPRSRQELKAMKTVHHHKC